MQKIWSQVGMPVIMVAVFCGLARGQAGVEYGNIDRRSSVTSRRTFGPGQEVGGVFRSLDRTLKASPDLAVSSNPSLVPPTRRAGARSAKVITSPRTPTPRKIYEDAVGIQAGMGYDELITRFGPPSFGVSSGTASETLAYSGSNGGVDVEVRDGVVAKVAATNPQEIAIVAGK